MHPRSYHHCQSVSCTLASPALASVSGDSGESASRISQRERCQTPATSVMGVAGRAADIMGGLEKNLTF